MSLLPRTLVLALAAAAPAQAAEVACRYEGGTLVLPAVVAGIAGDYILDTGAAQSALHETKAEAEGISDKTLAGDIQVAGMTVKAAPLVVQDLDVRTWNLPTPVAGVIGADALRGFVVDVDYAPCRVRLFAAGKEPRFAGRSLTMVWDLGRPAVNAAISDDAHRISGRFVIASGANVPIRLADDLAQTPGAGEIKELYPDGRWLARLPQVEFAGATGRDVAAGLMKPDGDVMGLLGGPVLGHFRLRFDFPRSRLVVQPVLK